MEKKFELIRKIHFIMCCILLLIVGYYLSTSLIHLEHFVGNDFRTAFILFSLLFGDAITVLILNRHRDWLAGGIILMHYVPYICIIIYNISTSTVPFNFFEDFLVFMIIFTPFFISLLYVIYYFKRKVIR